MGRFGSTPKWVRDLNNDEYLKIKAKITDAFKVLRKEKGIVARQNFLCCNSCAGYSIESTKPVGTKFVFYDRQDNAQLKERLKTYLSFGITGDEDKDYDKYDVESWGREISEVLRHSGLIVDWNGDISIRILITA